MDVLSNDPLKKDKEPFLKIKEIKNNIFIDNNGKENKPRSSLYLFFFPKKSSSPQKPYNLCLYSLSKNPTSDMLLLITYFIKTT